MNYQDLLTQPPIVEGDIDTATLPLPRVGLFFRMGDFLTELDQYDSMDVMTWSCFEPALGLIKPRVRRLIYSRETSYTFQRVGCARRAANVHAKLYLCRRSTSPPTAYIGSANWLPRGDFIELMIRTNKTQTRELARFFNKIWKQLK